MKYIVLSDDAKHFGVRDGSSHKVIVAATEAVCANSDPSCSDSALLFTGDCYEAPGHSSHLVQM